MFMMEAAFPNLKKYAPIMSEGLLCIAFKKMLWEHLVLKLNLWSLKEVGVFLLRCMMQNIGVPQQNLILIKGKVVLSVS